MHEKRFLSRHSIFKLYRHVKNGGSSEMLLSLMLISCRLSSCTLDPVKRKFSRLTRGEPSRRRWRRELRVLPSR